MSVAQVENRVSNWNTQTPLGQRFVGIAAEAHIERDVVLRHRVEEVHNGHVRVSARFVCARGLHRFVAVRRFSYFDIQDELIYMDWGGDPIPDREALETAYVEEYVEWGGVGVR